MFEVDISNIASEKDVNWFDSESVEKLKIKTIVPIDNMTFPIDNK